MRWASPTEIRRIAAPDARSFHDEFVATNSPVVIRGLVDRWPAAAKWSAEYLAQRLGHLTVRAEVSQSGRFSNYRLGERREMSFATFVAHVSSPQRANTLCVTNSSLGRDAKEELSRLLAADIEIPPYVAPRRHYLRPRYKGARSLNFFIGGGGNVTTLHYDSGAEALLALVRGRKKVTLFPPSQRRYLYASSPWQRAWVFNSSPVDVKAPDLTRYPLFGRARAIEFFLDPGEMLYLPSCWWHHVESFDFNVAINIPFALSLPRLLSRYGFDRFGHLAYVRLAELSDGARRKLRRLAGSAAGPPLD